MKQKTREYILIGALLTLLVLFPVLKRLIATAYDNYLWQKKTDNFLNTLQNPFKLDIYGGKTPEETWAMYVEAIKNKDIDLAAKYYDVEHQGKAREFLLKGLGSDKWDLYVNDITTNPLQKKKNVPDFLKSNTERAYYFYHFYDDSLKSDFNPDVNFYKNTLTGKWKILFP